MGFFDRIVAAALPMTPRPIVKIVARRYIAGDSIADAVDTVARLNDDGCLGTIDALGEFVKNREAAAFETERCLAVLDEIRSRGVASGLSVKLTSIGLEVDETFCRDNLRSILQRATERDVFVRIDMENTPYTDATLQIGRDMFEEFPRRVGVVLQAYLRRTLYDIEVLAPLGISVRLCKGIYVESEEVSFKGREEIQQNYLQSLRRLFELGAFVGIATHDDVLIDGARDIVEELGMSPGDYEFQMLLGVRAQKRKEIVAAGHRMRVYVPFGEDWYGYSIRRLKENPAVAGHVFKAMFTGE